jgi:hypothetical protein
MKMLLSFVRKKRFNNFWYKWITLSHEIASLYHAFSYKVVSKMPIVPNANNFQNTNVNTVLADLSMHFDAVFLIFFFL